MTKPGPHLREGNHQYCRTCGHDLLGLSGERCPACGRPVRPPERRPTDGASGRRLAVGVVGLGLALALVGLKYRRFEPRPAPQAPAPRPSPPATSAPHAAGA